jgi:TIR domain
MPESFEFDVFLSHNSRDKPAVRDLGRELVKRGIRPWLDEWELRPGRSWQDDLGRVIASTRSVAVLIGEDGIGPWEILEQQALLSDAVRRKLPVIPVLLPGAPQEPELPLFLANRAYVDLRGGLSKKGLDLLQWGITGTRPAAPADDGENFSVDDDFDVFLCFRDSDRLAVQHVAEDLRKIGVRSWPDDWSISSEESWRQLLSRRVQKIHALAVFATDDDGPWGDEQVESFIWELIENGQLVIPVILPSTQRPPKFPIYLRRKERIDFRIRDPNPAVRLASLLSENRKDEKGLSDG